MTPDELAHSVTLPPELASKDCLREFYGNVQWGVRAIFDGYLKWFDGNPTNLFSLPPAEEAANMVRLVGGFDALTSHARKALKNGESQWCAPSLIFMIQFLMFTVPYGEPEGVRPLGQNINERENIQQRAVVIGAAGGIGQALCRRPSQDGWAIAPGGRSMADRHREDATDAESVKSFFDHALNHLERLDAVAVYVGSLLLKPAHRTSLEDMGK